MATIASNNLSLLTGGSSTANPMSLRNSVRRLAKATTPLETLTRVGLTRVSLTGSKEEPEKADGDDGGPETPHACCDKEVVKTLSVRLALIGCSIVYTLIGTVVFYHLEKPHEIEHRAHNAREMAARQKRLLDASWAVLDDERLGDAEAERLLLQLLENYTDSVLVSLEQRRQRYRLEDKTEVDEWTYVTAFMFTASTLIPVGYGYTTTQTPLGRVVCVLYGMVGMPLTMITVADLARFASVALVQLVYRTKMRIVTLVCHRSRESVKMDLPLVAVSLLFLAYPCIGALLYVQLGMSSFIDSLYFCFVSIFTIGFGDIHPPGGVSLRTYLICITYLCVGMIIVSIAIDIVVAQCIQDVHFFGRRVLDMKGLTDRIRRGVESGRRTDVSPRLLSAFGIKPKQPKQQQPAELLGSPPISEASFANGHMLHIVFADSYTSLDSTARLL